MCFDYSASSPVLTMPSQQHAHPFDKTDFASTEQPLPPTSNNFANSNGNSNGSHPPSQAPFTGSPSSSILTKAPMRATTKRMAGRKRSRADIFDSAEDDDLIDDGSFVSQPAQAPKPRTEPVYGPGMTLVYPDDPVGLHIAPDSQTGTWAEERQAAIEASRCDSGRPAIVSRKSLRRFAGVGARAQSQSSLPEFNGDNDGMVHTPGAMVHDSPVEDDDHIDVAKLYLGVGWSSVSESPNLAIAARGWARFIENHFNLHHVSILLHNEGKQLYLVQASRYSVDQAVYWLFAEDLRSGQLLAYTTDAVVRNLTQHPIQFDGEVVQFRDRTPPTSNPTPQEQSAAAQDGSIARGFATGIAVDNPTNGSHIQDVDMMVE